MLTRRHKLIFLLTLTAVGIASVFLLPRIPQSGEYHRFSDAREIWSVPNFYNVASNFLFLMFGSMGLFLTLYLRERNSRDEMLPANLLFFTGIFLTGLGSAYYHLQPSTESLVWDRIPMAITFMSFFSAVISEYINLRIGRKIIFPLVFLGILSVEHWYKTEQDGHGDLRFYILIQFLPMLLIPLILLLFGAGRQISRYYWAIIAVYAMAKFTERFDYELFYRLHYISGHSLKHLLASVAPVIYLSKIWKQKINLSVQNM